MIQRKLLFLPVLLLHLVTTAQTISQKLAAAFRRFEQDSQMQSGLASLYVADESGHVLFQKNSTIGLAPASTQKIITSATAYELLGRTFRYQTTFGFLQDSDGTSSLLIQGSGDPTLGSWRWPATKTAVFLNRIEAAAKGTLLNSTVFLDTTGWAGEAIPGGWIWDDIGNYYGAGAGVLNWRENQYDVFLRSGAAIGDPAIISGTEPVLHNFKLSSKVRAAAKGSGDNAYIYFSLNGDSAVVRGTIPGGESRFKISGAMPDPEQQFAATLFARLSVKEKKPLKIVYTPAVTAQMFHAEQSPPLDSLIYWFNKKSINLYGEALLRTIGYQKTRRGSTENGIAILKSFWAEKGISKTALNLVDGSGLSPLNRITTQAQAAVLQYARKQPWFPGFYTALPEYNGMKLKSGTIQNVKGFAGYHTSRAGVSYTIAFLVNNYDGSSATLVKKMYAVLDVLK
jgi:D-alanyl-D-alanine carboxypeptidase/D-alanyl-D-alanine-endopeptidase (penicillin-binding protein 4)